MTALESAGLEQVLQGTVRPPGRQLEDLDMQEIARVMVAIQRMRRDKIEEIRQLQADLADAVRTAAVVRAREFLSAPGPQQQRDQASRLAAAGAVFGADMLRAELDAAKDSLRLLKDDWDTCRSVMANQRAQASAIEGYGT